MQVLRRLQYLFRRTEQVAVFTEHKNVLPAIIPMAGKHSFGIQKAIMVIQGVLHFYKFSYDQENVSGAPNTMKCSMIRLISWYQGSPSFVLSFARSEMLSSESVFPTFAAEEEASPNIDNICTT